MSKEVKATAIMAKFEKAVSMGETLEVQRAKLFVQAYEVCPEVAVRELKRILPSLLDDAYEKMKLISEGLLHPAAVRLKLSSCELLIKRMPSLEGQRFLLVTGVPFIAKKGERIERYVIPSGSVRAESADIRQMTSEGKILDIEAQTEEYRRREEIREKRNAQLKKAREVEQEGIYAQGVADGKELSIKPVKHKAVKSGGVYKLKAGSALLTAAELREWAERIDHLNSK